MGRIDVTPIASSRPHLGRHSVSGRRIPGFARREPASRPADDV